MNALTQNRAVLIVPESYEYVRMHHYFGLLAKAVKCNYASLSKVVQRGQKDLPFKFHNV